MSSAHPIYQYFTKVSSPLTTVIHFKCIVCLKKTKWTGSPQNLINHLTTHASHHREFATKNAARKRKAADPPGEVEEVELQPAVVQTQAQTQLSQLWAVDREEKEAMAECFMTNGLPLSLASDPKFLRWMSLRKNAPVLTPYLLRKEMVQYHSKLKNKVIEALKENNSPVSIVLDGWTNVNKVKVTNLLLVSQGIAYYWCSICNDDSSNDTAWLYSALKPELEAIVEEGIAFVSYVADNENLMGAVHGKLVADFPFLIRIPCAAHSIQLAVRKILASPAFNDTIKQLIALINLFVKNKTQRLLLINAQPATNRFRLIRPCDTRWSYTLFAIQRILKLRSYVDLALREGKQPRKSPFWWGSLESIVKILKPFAKATNIIQQDSATLFTVAQQFKVLEAHADTLQHSHPYISRHIKFCLSHEWTKHVNQLATIACAILVGDTTVDTSYPGDQVIEAQNYITDWGVKYLKYYELTNVSDIEATLTNQFVEFMAKHKRFACWAKRINATQQTILIKEKKKRGAEEKEEKEIAPKEIMTESPIAVWQTFVPGAPELGRVAIALLSICASEAAVERSFSIQDRIHSKNRNRSGDELVEAQVFVKFNSIALEKRTELHEQLIEIADELEMQPVTLEYLTTADELESVAAPEEQEDEAVESNVELENNDEVEEEARGSEEEEEENEEDEEVDESILESDDEVITVANEIQVKQFLIHYLKRNKLKPTFKMQSDRHNHLANAVAKANPRITNSVRGLQTIIRTITIDEINDYDDEQFDTM